MTELIKLMISKQTTNKKKANNYETIEIQKS